MTLAELQDKRKRLVTEARAALEEIKSNTDDSRAAELEERHDAIMADFDVLEADIEREKRVAAAERDIAESEERDRLERANRRPGRENRERDAGEEGDDDEITYRSAFHQMLAVRGNVALMTPEARGVLESGYTEVPEEESRALVSGTDSAGGYAVPTEMMKIIVKAMAQWGPMYDEEVCTHITTTSGSSMPFPTIDDTANEAAGHTEGTTLTDDGGVDPVLGSKSLDAYAFDTEWIRVSKELNDDSFLAMEQFLGMLLGERLGRKSNRELTVGSGSSAPNGIVTASGLGHTAAAVAALTWDELFDLEHSVDPAHRESPKCRYMFNDGTLKALRKLTDGNGNYLWQEGNVKAGIPNQINAKPYSINQAMDSLAAAKKVIVFGDFAKYFVRKVGAPLVGAIQDKDFWPGFGMAGYVRIDGELGDAGAVKHLITAAS